MKDFKKYLPMNTMLFLQAIIVWAVAYSTNKSDLGSFGCLFLWTAFMFVSYGVVNGSEPKDDKQK